MLSKKRVGGFPYHFFFFFMRSSLSGSPAAPAQTARTTRLGKEISLK